MQGDILFYATKGDLLGNLVSWWTNSRFVHASVDVGDETTIEAVQYGIIRRPIGVWKPTAIWSYQHNVSDRDGVDMMNAIAWLKSMAGKPYGVSDLVGAAYEKFISSFYVVQLQHWDCSALCTEFLAQAGGVNLGDLALDPHKVTPAMLARKLGVK